jgi:hypothetical protein
MLLDRMRGSRYVQLCIRQRFVGGLILAALVGVASSGFGQSAPPAPPIASIQTQSPPAHSRLFPAPELKFHDLPFRPEDMGSTLPRQSNAFASQMSSGTDAAQASLFKQIEQEGSLRPAEPVFKTDVGRKIANAFRPEIIHVGHVHIYSSIVTAIARKNPLCLLSPVALDVSF